MMRLYGMPRTRSFRALWALEEVGAEYDYQVINLGKGQGQEAEFLKLNPGGKLPVLVDGDLVLRESAAICTYLADCYPQQNMAPACGTPERALFNQWCFFVLSELEQPLWTIAKHKFALPKEYRIRDVVETAVFEFSRAAKILETGLSGNRSLVGTGFSMADLLAVHTLVWAKAFKLNHGLSALDNYRDTGMQRPAYQRAAALDLAKEEV